MRIKPCRQKKIHPVVWLTVCLFVCLDIYSTNRGLYCWKNQLEVWLCSSRIEDKVCFHHGLQSDLPLWESLLEAAVRPVHCRVSWRYGVLMHLIPWIQQLLCDLVWCVWTLRWDGPVVPQLLRLLGARSFSRTQRGRRWRLMAALSALQTEFERRGAFVRSHYPPPRCITLVSSSLLTVYFLSCKKNWTQSVRC